MNISALRSQIDEVRKWVEGQTNNAGIFEWLSDCQVYLENYHKNSEFTKQFIQEASQFRSSIISFQSYLLDSFDVLAAIIKSVEKLENEKNERTKQRAEKWKDINLSKRSDL